MLLQHDSVLEQTIISVEGEDVISNFFLNFKEYNKRVNIRSTLLQLTISSTTGEGGRERANLA